MHNTYVCARFVSTFDEASRDSIPVKSPDLPAQLRAMGLFNKRFNVGLRAARYAHLRSAAAKNRSSGETVVRKAAGTCGGDRVFV
jgi:hypothetical protein